MLSIVCLVALFLLPAETIGHHIAHTDCDEGHSPASGTCYLCLALDQLGADAPVTADPVRRDDQHLLPAPSIGHEDGRRPLIASQRAPPGIR